VEPIDADGRANIDKALQEWRQGDCVLGEQWFAFRIAPDAPLSDDAVTAAAEGAENAESEVFGFAAVTQTCDIVRGCDERSFVEVCPLVEVDEDKLHEIERGRRPNYAHIPGVSNQRLVADLDRVMTVEKPVLAPATTWRAIRWTSTTSPPEEGRRFARCQPSDRLRQLRASGSLPFSTLKRREESPRRASTSTSEKWRATTRAARHAATPRHGPKRDDRIGQPFSMHFRRYCLVNSASGLVNSRAALVYRARCNARKSRRFVVAPGVRSIDRVDVTLRLRSLRWSSSACRFVVGLGGRSIDDDRHALRLVSPGSRRLSGIVVAGRPERIASMMPSVSTSMTFWRGVSFSKGSS